MRIGKICLTSIIVLFLTSGCLVNFFERKTARQLQLELGTIEIKGNKGYVKGVLGKLFHKKLEKTLKKYPNLNTLVLTDIPGSLNDEWNLKSCLLIYEKGITTELVSNSIVESGGTDLFVSGKKIIFAEGAKIGVHSWDGGDKPATSYPKDHAEHKMFLELYSKVGIDTPFYWFTLQAAPADGMHFMEKAEIEKYLGHKMK